MFRNRSALITGGSRGIGRAIAEALARRGARVVVTARTQEVAAAAAAEIAGTTGAEAAGVGFDLADREATTAAVAGPLSEQGPFGILVNNAGMTRDGLLLRLKPADWEAVVEANLSSVYRITRAVLPAMIRAREGRIVTVTSVVGRTGNPGQTNYAAAKAGLEGFSRSLAREVASRNVTVNCVAPGFIETEMTAALPEATRSQLLSQVPLGRLGRPEDVADAVVFLASPAAGYVTGTTLHVNGGMFM